MPLNPGSSQFQIFSAEDLGLTVAQSVPFTFTWTRETLGNGIYRFAELLEFIVIYTASAVVANRRPIIIISTDTGGGETLIQARITQVAGTIRTHHYSQGAIHNIFFGSSVMEDIPYDLFCKQDYTMQFSAVTAGAGDIQNINFMARLWY